MHDAVFYLVAGTNTIGSTVIEIVTDMATRAVETGIPVVELSGGDAVSLGKVTTPAVRRSDSRVLVTGRDDMSNSVGRSTGRGRAPVITRS
jgi:hypothetical protein